MRWEEPVIQNKMLCTLELKTDDNKNYKQISQWTFVLTGSIWLDLAEKGTSFSCSSEQLNQIEEWISPKDLHKYTGTKEDISQNKPKSSPSYLDYENKD